ncbi:MAG: response regulator transcription factor [Bacteroidia bacterium]
MTLRDIHVAIVEDDPEIRQLLRILLDGSAGFACALAFATAEDALPEILYDRPDIVLMDIGLPGMSGVEAVGRLKAAWPDVVALMLTVQMDDDSVFRSLCAGASGYLLKQTPPTDLLIAIREAHTGGAPMSPGIARRVVRSFFQPQIPSPLSEREAEVLRMLCDGENYRSIAEALFISTNTVKAHIKHVYEKLHVHTRAEAVKKALRDGLI